MTAGNKRDVLVGAEVCQQRHELLRIRELAPGEQGVKQVHELRRVERLQCARELTSRA
jgi:hypothetical protein